MKIFEIAGKYKSVGWLVGLVLLGVVAAVSFYFTDKTRKTFVFYDMKSEQARAEERMLMQARPRLRSVEAEVGQYAEEAVFGPRNPASAPLFPKGTKLASFFYRDAVAYIDLSEDAALPVALPKQQSGLGAGESTISRNMVTLKEGIKRNFPFVKETRIFISGHEIKI
jgi:hypothetical protein